MQNNWNQFCQRVLGLLVLTTTIFTTARADAGDQKTYTDENGIAWRYTDLGGDTCALGWGYNQQHRPYKRYYYYNSEGALVNYGQIGEVTAPEEINGLKVRSLMAGAFAHCDSITTLTLPKGLVLQEDASNLFYECKQMTTLTNGVGDWNLSKVTNLGQAFRSCSVLSSPLDVSKWDVSNVTNMANMFLGCVKIEKLDVSHWDVGKVTDMGATFSGCSSLKDTLDVSNWNTENVTTLYNTFISCRQLTYLDVSKWNTGKVESMKQTFSGCSKLDSLDVSKWNTENVTDMESTFSNCTNLKDPLDVSGWKTDKVTTLKSTFNGCSSLTKLDVSKWNTENVTTLYQTFNGCKKLKDTLDVSGWKTDKVTTLYMTFQGCQLLTVIDVSKWNTSLVTNMNQTFKDCKKVKVLDVAGWTTDKVTVMSGTFRNTAVVAPLAISDWNVSKVTNFNYFLESSAGADTLDISKWQFSNNFTDITNKSKLVNSPAYMMFAPVKRIKLPASTLPVHISGMFYETQALELTLPSDITAIGYKCFASVKQLQQITIPANVTSIEESAFAGTRALKEVFMMPATPPTLTDTIGLGKTIIYVKSSALEAYKTADVWSTIADRITDRIPLTLASGRTYATLGRDFDCDFTDSGITPYKATEYEKTESGTQNVTIEPLTDYYVPSRTGDDNYTFHGVLLKAKASGTYYYKMGENDYASDSPNTSLADAETNYFVPSYETWYLDPTWQNDPKNWLYYPKEDSYNYALSNNVLKGIRNAGNTARNKAFLSLPHSLFGEDKYSEAKSLVMVFDDQPLTGINLVEREATESDARYNLAGQRVGKAYKGIVIRNGKKYYNQ